MIHYPSAQLDYVHPLDERRCWGAGFKAYGLVSPGTADYAVQAVGSDEFVRQAAQSYSYHYQRLIQQGYSSYQQKAGKWDYQAGLRAEVTGLQARVQPTGSASQ